MSKVNLIRLLLGLNMILFMLPFFNACSEPTKGRHNELFENVDIDNFDFQRDILNNEHVHLDSPKNEYHEMDLNAYQLAVTPFKEADKNIFSESFFYFCLCFTVIIILNLIMIFFSLNGNLKSVQFFNSATIAILLLSLLIPYSSGILEKFNQIKIGFYLFLLNLFLIAWLIRKSLKKRKSSD